MVNITAGQSLGDVVAAMPASARVLESFGLDYCCGGQRSLGDSCSEAGIDPGAVLAALADVEGEMSPDWISMGPVELVDHIEATHHAYLHTELGRLDELADKVAEHHGDGHPELVEVSTVYRTLHADLAPHLLKEERVLFPMIRELAGSAASPAFHCGSLRNPISVLIAEHDRAGELLAMLHSITGGYETPADGCASYRALYDGLAELESDTHLHVYKENSLLFPAVIALEQRKESRNDEHPEEASNPVAGLAVMSLSAQDWLDRFAEALGTDPLTTAEVEALLELAGIAAHASERTAAPVSCFVAARAGKTLSEALGAARRLASEIAQE
jgi:regulator of cell morphogenesis and NO signaling